MSPILDETFVYLIVHLSGGRPRGPVKVGYTRHPQKRLASLQTGNPDRLQILAQFTTPTPAHAQQMEALFHKIARHKRLSGEWFDLDPVNALATALKLLAAIIDQDVPNHDDAIALLKWAGVPEAMRKLAEIGSGDN